MINDFDRSWYFGGSDAANVLSDKRHTKTWQNWYLVKLGHIDSTFTGNIYTRAGTNFEHSILRSISPDMFFDRQLIIDDLRLRINYDGDLDGTIYEVKTHKDNKEFEVTDAYYAQAQLQMYVWQEHAKRWNVPPFKSLYIVDYPLHADEYYLQPDPETVEEGLLPVELNRIHMQEIPYDKSFIKGVYLPKHKELLKAMRKGKKL